MRIAIFADSFYPVLGGLEDSTAILARSLGEIGHEVDLYVPYFAERNYLGRGLPAKDLDLGERVKIYHLSSSPLPYWLFGARLVVPTLSGYRLLKKNRPDIIHTQSIFGAGLEALWASYRLELPLIGTNHSIISEFGAYFPFARKFFIKTAVWYETWFYNHCRVITVPSQTVKEAMMSNGVLCPIKVISNIIDTHNFCLRTDDQEKLKAEFGLSGRSVISFAGRFAIEKRGDVLLRAMSLVRQQFPRAVLALAGSGIQQDNWEKIIRDLDLGDNVKFVGILDKTKLRRLFQASEAFVIASAIESQGMVALQAMACGLPVVGVNGRAIPEYVGADNGFIVPVDDYRKMADCLVTILRDDELAQRLGQRGRQKAEKFSKENIIREWNETYNLVLKEI